MFKTHKLLMPRRFYTELDYAMHMPKPYVDRMKRQIPMKVYDNRFGAPPVTRWALPPGDYQPYTKRTMDGEEFLQPKRPWEGVVVQNTIQREKEYQRSLYSAKFFRKGEKKMPTIPAEEWTIFQGDLVEVMIGKDKGRQAIVSHVIREENAVYVEGLHTKMVTDFAEDAAKIYDTKPSVMADELPLFVHRGQVKLVDPNDGEACTAQWILNDPKTDYIRVSTRTGYEIPLPKTAYRTYEYATTASYIECATKDTPADVMLKQTYVPRLSTFEQEIEEELGLEKRPIYTDEERPPTYWY